MARVPNDNQLKYFYLHFHRQPDDIGSDLVRDINLKRSENESEWTEHEVYMTYQLISIGSGFLTLWSAQPTLQQIRAKKEIEDFFSDSQQKIDGEFINAFAEIFNRVD